MEDLIYGDALNSLIFMTKQRAEDYEKLYKGLRAHSTWGELRKSVPAKIVKELVRRYGKLNGAERFELNGDGDWPFPQQEQLEFLPKDVAALGEIQSTVFNGDMIEFPYNNEQEIVSRLRAHGFKVVKNDRLVRAACNDLNDY